MLRDYIRLIAFALGLLVGVQLPAFVGEYAKRADAHYLEAKTNFAGFQETADQHFKGDVEAMIRHHDQSGDAVFQADAASIRSIWQRLLLWQSERDALNRPFPVRAFHVLFHANPELMAETRSNYTHTVPLTQDAILSGIVAGLLAAIAVELVVAGLARMLGMGARQRA